MLVAGWNLCMVVSENEKAFEHDGHCIVLVNMDIDPRCGRTDALPIGCDMSRTPRSLPARSGHDLVRRKWPRPIVPLRCSAMCVAEREERHVSEIVLLGETESDVLLGADIALRKCALSRRSGPPQAPRSGKP